MFPRDSLWILAGTAIRLGRMLSSALSNPLLPYITAVAVLVWGLKRLWAIDLELRAHRHRQLARLYEAQKEAELARKGDRGRLALRIHDRRGLNAEARNREQAQSEADSGSRTETSVPPPSRSKTSKLLDRVEISANPSPSPVLAEDEEDPRPAPRSRTTTPNSSAAQSASTSSTPSGRPG